MVYTASCSGFVDRPTFADIMASYDRSHTHLRQSMGAPPFWLFPPNTCVKLFAPTGITTVWLHSLVLGPRLFIIYQQ